VWGRVTTKHDPHKRDGDQPQIDSAPGLHEVGKNPAESRRQPPLKHWERGAQTLHPARTKPRRCRQSGRRILCVELATTSSIFAEWGSDDTYVVAGGVRVKSMTFVRVCCFSRHGESLPKSRSLDRRNDPPKGAGGISKRLAQNHWRDGFARHQPASCLLGGAWGRISG